MTWYNIDRQRENKLKPQKGFDFMKTITTIEELMNELENGSGYWGVRGASEHDIEVSDRGYLDCSLDLFDRRDCDYDEEAEMLNGTCAIGINSFMEEGTIEERYEQAMRYASNHHMTNVVYLLNDSNCEYGEDENEVILGSNGYGANIVAIVDIK